MLKESLEILNFQFNPALPYDRAFDHLTTAD